ncbi:hypothetical protein AABM38_03715 [Heyndrickxia sp. MSNUG]|uniref:hypothetical protein n=1 Tax=Heyndrickxia sp. MSNUG TaxID=3136677 RepID=UPI003C2E5740
MFYQDYQTFAKLKQQEVERKAKHAWKFFEQSEMKETPMPADSSKQPNCCVTPANA